MPDQPRYALVRVELVGSTHKTPAGDSLLLARLASRPEIPCFAVGEEDLVTPGRRDESAQTLTPQVPG